MKAAAILIGAGFVGKAHVEALRRLGVEIRGVLGSTPERGEESRAELGLPRAYASIEGQPGAGACVLMAIRKGWTITPAVSVAKNQDMVHRAVSRKGVVLVGEGTNAVRSMLSDERKKMERFLPGTPVVEVIVGDGDGRVALRKLQKHVRKLPKTISQTQLREIKSRLKAVGGMNIPLPKGPMPKGARLPKAR